MLQITPTGALAAAYDAYQAHLQSQATPGQGGFSGDQEFFFAYAQSWAEKQHDAALRQEVLADTHSPDGYRALTVRNLNRSNEAFDIEPEISNIWSLEIAL